MTGKFTFAPPTAKYVTFGCKLNFAETATIARILEQEAGIAECAPGSQPDFIVVNSCSVTAVADRKCRQTIRTLNRRYPQAAIVVTGCYAQLKPREVAELSGVAIVVGNHRKNELSQLIEAYNLDGTKQIAIEPSKDFKAFEPSCSRGNRTRYFLKIQDGCNYFCSYCAIPYARGRSRSPEIHDLVEQARKVAAEGGKEIVLTGVNIGHYGWGTDHDFYELITELDKVDGIERYRISSIEPNLLDERIVSFVAQSGKFMPHFHIPLQCGSDEVLRLMRRHYDTALFRQRVEMVRHYVPDAFIGIDIIVGMRGETDELFEQSRRFIESLDISRLHVFPYSEREGTAALNIPHPVDPAEKKRRLQAMLELSEDKEVAFSRRFKGSTRPVLFERFDNSTKILSGHTDNYLKIEVTASKGSSVNSIVPVIIGEPFPDANEGFVSKGVLV